MAENISGNKGSHNQILDGVTMKIRKTIYEAKTLNIFFFLSDDVPHAFVANEIAQSHPKPIWCFDDHL